VAVNAGYLAGALLCLALDLVPPLRKYKIQPQVHGLSAWWRCTRHVVLNKLMSEIPMTVIAYPLFIKLGVSKDLPLPGWGALALTLAACFVVEDAWHYFAHRSLHTRWGYQHIHYMHHHYTTPFGVAANYAHPLETLWTGFGTALPVLLFRPHLSTMLIWIMVRQWQAISVHVGYDFPWRPSRFIPFMGGARFHDRHHRRFNRNYAPTFVWLDRLLGTADERDLGPRAAGAPESPVIVEE
jgi:sterol desaturase/sphingolipid hydroxylase (fatty acid hydroxylase superfamily)